MRYLERLIHWNFLFCSLIIFSSPILVKAETDDSINKKLTEYPPYLLAEPMEKNQLNNFTELNEEPVNHFWFNLKTIKISLNQPFMVQISSDKPTKEMNFRIPEQATFATEYLTEEFNIIHDRGEYWKISSEKETNQFYLPIVFEYSGQFFLSVDNDAQHMYVEVMHEEEDDDEKTIVESVLESHLTIPQEKIEIEEKRIWEQSIYGEQLGARQSKSQVTVNNWSQFRSAWNNHNTGTITVDRTIVFSSSILGDSLGARITSITITNSSRRTINLMNSGHSLVMNGAANLTLNNIDVMDSPGGLLSRDVRTQPLIIHNGSGIVNLNNAEVNMITGTATSVVRGQNITILGDTRIHSRKDKDATADVNAHAIYLTGSGVLVVNTKSRAIISSTNDIVRPPIMSTPSSKVEISVDSLTMKTTWSSSIGASNTLASWRNVSATLAGTNASRVEKSTSSPNDFAVRYTENYQHHGAVIFNPNKNRDEWLEPSSQNGNVLVNYLDKSGNHLIEPETITGEVGKEYKSELKEIPGYYLLVPPSNANGTITTETQTVNYNYVKIHDHLINTDFEEPPITSDFSFIHQSKVPGWYTTASDKMIEFGLGPAHNIFGPASGRQFVELIANEPGELYQLVSFEPGTILRWRLHHAGRNGIDEMRLNIGSPKQPEIIRDIKSDKGKWTLHTGTYKIPENQPITYFGFEALRSSSGSLTMGNLLDNIYFAKQSNIDITNNVNKKRAQAGDTLAYDIEIANNGGVPSDRHKIYITGIDNLNIDHKTIQLDGYNIREKDITIEEGKLIVNPDITLENTSSINLRFEAAVKSHYLSGDIDTKATIEYWDEGFDDISYKAESNISNTKIETLVPKPLDPLSPEINVDPENQPNLPEDQGLLSIDFISSFNFGSQTISAQIKRYYARPQRLLNLDGTVNDAEERPNYIQVSDRRSEEERQGWTLAVTQNNQFTDRQGNQLRGARLLLNNQQFASVQENGEPILQNQDGAVLIPEQKMPLLTARNGQGAGTWIYRFGDGESAGESVALEVPPTADPRATTYQTTLTWELSAVPDN
ncbi:WxL domain-containing protein [Enterococcus casseliflavus]